MKPIHPHSETIEKTPESASTWRNMVGVDTSQTPHSPFSQVRLGDYILKMPHQLCTSNIQLPLSPREKQALFLFAIGYTGPEVAETLGVTSNTVGTFKRRIFMKTGTKTIAEAATLATAYALGGTLKKAA